MTRRTVAGWLLALVTLTAISSTGGAAIAGAPVLLPALWLAARRSGGWARRGFVTLAAVVAAEVAWAGVYVTGGEHDPAIWVAPAAAALLVAVGFSETSAAQ